MDTETAGQEEIPAKTAKPGIEKQQVYTIRDWKEYLGESLLIIFSVLLALLVTEYLNNLHEKDNTRNILKSIVAELNHNKTAIREMKQYNLQVLNRIDSALVNKKLQSELVLDDEFDIKKIAPEGVLYRYLDNAAWTIAKASNITSKVDVETVAMLTRLYIDQDKMMKVEEEVAKVFFDRSSRDPKQVRATLILIRDIYHAWAVDRTDGLLLQADNAIKKVDAY
jgi:hypothetical protein